MLEKMIRYFATRHMLANCMTIGVILAAVFAWEKTGKEETPNYELNFITIRTAYPGAAPEDVEQLVTKRLEEKLKSIDGIYRLQSTSTIGSSTIRIEFIPGYDAMDEALNDIRNQTASVKLPAEVRDPPSVRQFKTTRRAVLDVAVYLTNHHTLDRTSRAALQKYAYDLSDQLGGLTQVSEVSMSGYYKNELQILLNTDRLREYNISTSEVIAVLKKHNLRVPAGGLDDTLDTKVSVVAELDTVAKLSNLVIRASFDSPAIFLSDLATIRPGFEKNTSIRKVNGHEAVTLNIRKTASSDILQTTDAVRAFIARYERDVLANTPARIQLLDDGSSGVRNRLSLIVGNGILGFILILVFLFLFMDATSAFWVAMGIPFTFFVTMIAFPLMGYTVNNITLAAIIIVMGMIVDDAIVVAENIARLRSAGIRQEDACILGTREMVLPVFGSIATTVVAFVPLFFFSGRYSQMLVFIPPVIAVMLFASFFESIFVLPAHLGMHLPKPFMRFVSRLGFFRRTLSVQQDPANGEKELKAHWFVKVEQWYARILEHLLHHRIIVTAFFIALLVTAGLVFSSQFKFVLFPDEESNELNISGFAPQGSSKEQTEVLVRSIENLVNTERPANVVGYRSVIAQSRRGGAADQSSFAIVIELKERENRTKSTEALMRQWREQVMKIPDLERVTVTAGRFGSGSGSAIEVEVRENDDAIRKKAAEAVRDALDRLPGLRNAEVDEPIRNPEYRIGFNRELVTRLGVNPSELATAMRTVLEGTIVDEINSGDEEVDIRVSVDGNYKQAIDFLLQNPIQNSGDYLIPLSRLVSYERVLAPSSITRIHHKRTTMVYADIDDGKSDTQTRRPRKKPATNTIPKDHTADKLSVTDRNPGLPGEAAASTNRIRKTRVRPEPMTPIEVASWLEERIFPKIQQQYPGVVFSFSGEIKDTRESSGDLGTATILVLFLIFVILALIFNSALRPAIVMMTIPFGLVGIIFTFWIHGIEQFGLFAAIGALGLAGVVINDSIVMIDKLDRSIREDGWGKSKFERIANISGTRLRAVMLTTLTTVAGLMPTAYGVAGYDAMLAQMMLALSWGLLFGTLITLILIPTIYTFLKDAAPAPVTGPLPEDTPATSPDQGSKPRKKSR
ncbi:MAG TPA: efflux RND transporter permease subunit [Spirochaetota bacterium]|nr:efflux RND transporter permease subunit [Spirochaetota bacterium]